MITLALVYDKRFFNGIHHYWTPNFVYIFISCHGFFLRCAVWPQVLLSSLIFTSQSLKFSLQTREKWMKQCRWLMDKSMHSQRHWCSWDGETAEMRNYALMIQGPHMIHCHNVEFVLALWWGLFPLIFRQVFVLKKKILANAKLIHCSLQNFSTGYFQIQSSHTMINEQKFWLHSKPNWGISLNFT